MGQRVNFNEGDVKRINYQYKCINYLRPPNTPYVRPPYRPATVQRPYKIDETDANKPAVVEKPIDAIDAIEAVEANNV